ncbi:hypothetical protein LWI28_021529 [Acer negundo]|uniref:Uncharacterized protein n=1 Tax=Acer negundo TaxID=4023 RepID=A0AAD5IML8_ACENE|nr:hypothetical protein LWI28_021529 [Acer negundo]
MKPAHFQAALDGDVNKSPFCDINDPNMSHIFYQVSPSGNSLLHAAASCGHVEIVELMARSFPLLILKKNRKGDTAVHVAVKAGKLNTVIKLVECAKQIPSTSNRNESLLRMKNKGGNTALHEALLLLVETKKSVDTLVDVARYLVTEDPEVSYHLNNITRKSPLCLAVELNNNDILEYILKALPYVDVIRLLRGTKRVYPLHLACENGHVRVVQKLLRKWPDPTELMGDNDQNILHVAAKNGKEEVVRFLLKQDGLDKLINEMDENGNTPLHLAALHHHSIVVASLLLDKRSNPHLVNHHGLTAYGICQENMYGKVLEQPIDVNDGNLKASGNTDQKKSSKVKLKIRSNEIQKPKHVETPVHERDLRDIEIDELRRQVQQLQEGLGRLEALGHDDSRHGSKDGISNNEEKVNPFYHAHDRVPGEEAPLPRQVRRNQVFPRNLPIKLEIPDF